MRASTARAAGPIRGGLLKLTETDPQSPQFDTALQKLVDAVTHHVEEEESTVLPAMTAQLDQARRQKLGAEFADSRAEHMGDRPGQPSKAELELQAANVGLTGASAMDKDQLVKALKASA